MNFLKKLLVFVAFTSTLVLASPAVASGQLKLSNKAGSTINVSCNGKAGTPIITQLLLPYSFLAAIFGSHALVCTFTNTTGTIIGKANFTIKADNGLASVAIQPPLNPNFSVVITPGQNIFSSIISVTISKAKA